MNHMQLAAATLIVATVCINASAQRVRTSSAYDYNLTGQLLTDGITECDEPVFLEAFADGRPLPRREREWAIGGNEWCRNVVSKSLAYRWHGMAVDADEVRIVCYVQHQPDAKARPSSVTLKGNGFKATRRFEGMPGEPHGTSQHSDPNKRVAGVRLPTRLVELSFAIGRQDIRELSLRFDMPGAECWRVHTIQFMREGREVTDVLPSSRFSSCWLSAVEPAKHHEVTLEGVDPDADVQLHWLKGYKPKRFQLTRRDSTLTITMDGSPQVGLTEIVTTPKNSDTCELRSVSCGLSRESGAMRQGRDICKPARCINSETLTPSFARRASEPNSELCSCASNLKPKTLKISRHDTLHWRPAVVPGSVLTSYAPDEPSESFFNSDFWYRGEFSHTADGRRVFLNAGGINWKADFMVNGIHVGHVDGAFRRGRFDVTHAVHEGDNVLMVHIFPCAHPGAVKEKNLQSSDFNGGLLAADSPTFLSNVGWDWIPTVPGRNIGIWDDICLSHEGDVTLLDPVVTTVLDDSLRASITARVRVVNNATHAVIGRISGTIGPIAFSRPITLEAGQEREVVFSPDEFPELSHRQMRLWWPNDMGEAYMHPASFALLGDTLHYSAGLRELTYKEVESRLQLYVNRRRVHPMGGNWGFPEENLRYTPRDYDIAVRLHRDMHFNMIRNWVGQTPHRAFYEACDRYGILVWQDFWLANPADGPDPDDERMFIDNAHDYVRRIRRHPCVALYCGRNEGYPPASLDSALRRCVATLHPTLLYISSSADEGVSGHGPYWAVPRHEYFAKQTGRLHTERGLPNVMNIESLRRTMADGELWPQGDAWGRHDYVMEGAQRGASFNSLVENYGHPTDAASFCRLAQWQNYEGHRAMFEADNVQRQGLLMWMSHPCHPSMTWQTYDYHFDTGAAFFAIRKACEPMHVQFDSQRRRVQVVGRNTAPTPLTVRAMVLSPTGSVEAHAAQRLTLCPDTTVDVLPTLALPTDSATRFLRLQLIDADTRITSDNTYLYNAHGDDFTDLTASTPPPTLEVRHSGHTALVVNNSPTPALMIRLRLVDAQGRQVLPAYFSDNYFHLMPHEQRLVTVDWDGPAEVVRVTAEPALP